MKNFKASLDPTAKIVTTGVTIVFALLSIWPFFEVNEDGTAVLIVPAFLVVCYFAVWVYSPKSYSVTKDSLLVHRLIGNVVIAKSDIKTAEVQPKGMPFAMRTFGVGGLFGYFGLFYNFDSGNMTWYLTNRNNAIVITTNSGKKYVVSPDEREAFILALG